MTYKLTISHCSAFFNNKQSQYNIDRYKNVKQLKRKTNVLKDIIIFKINNIMNENQICNKTYTQQQTSTKPFFINVNSIYTSLSSSLQLLTNLQFVLSNKIIHHNRNYIELLLKSQIVKVQGYEIKHSYNPT